MAAPAGTVFEPAEKPRAIADRLGLNHIDLMTVMLVPGNRLGN